MTVFQFAIARVAVQRREQIFAGERLTEEEKGNARFCFDWVRGYVAENHDFLFPKDRAAFNLVLRERLGSLGKAAERVR